MQGEFEKRIQKKIQQFRLAPSKQVWDDVAADLNSRKKRRFFGWWWAPAASVLFIAGSAWFMYSSQTPEAIKPINAVAIVKGSNASQTATDVTALTTKKNHSIKRNTAYNLTGSHNTAQEQLLEEEEKTFINKLPDNLTIETRPAAIESFSIYNVVPATNDVRLQQQPILNNAPNKKVIDAAAGSSLLQTGDKNIYNAAALKPILKPEKKSPHFSFVFATGSTNITDKNVLVHKKNNLVYYPLPTANVPNPTPDTLKYMRKSYSGYHFSAGIQYNKKLDKHWSFYSGLQYSFLSNRQKMGPKSNGTISISRTLDTSFSVYRPFIKVPYHYVDGTSVTLRNYAHWVELPISFGYTINPAAKNKIEFRTGVTAAYMFSYKWLIADGRYSKFYYSGSLTTERIFNWHGDANISLPNNLTVGLQMKHSLTSLAKKPVQPSLYWSNFSIYTTIPIH